MVSIAGYHWCTVSISEVEGVCVCTSYLLTLPTSSLQLDFTINLWKVTFSPQQNLHFTVGGVTALLHCPGLPCTCGNKKVKMMKNEAAVCLSMTI